MDKHKINHNHTKSTTHKNTKHQSTDKNENPRTGQKKPIWGIIAPNNALMGIVAIHITYKTPQAM